MRPDKLILAVLLLACGSAPALAEYQPVTPEDIPRLVARRGKLYPTRPVRGRGPGTALQLYPGDVVTAVAQHAFSGSSRPSPTLIEVEVRPGQRQVLHIEELSSKPLDYSYRGKQSFDAFWKGLAVDAVRLMELYQSIIARHGYQLPRPAAGESLSADWYRLNQLRDHFSYLRMRLFDRAYQRGDERRLLEKEKDWLPARGEEFITQYAGQLSPEKRKQMQQVYLTMNSLANLPSFCFKAGELQRAIDHPESSDKYQDLAPAHRARLQAEDVARSHTALTELKAKLVVTVTEARARLLAAGIKAH